MLIAVFVGGEVSGIVINKGFAAYCVIAVCFGVYRIDLVCACSQVYVCSVSKIVHCKHLVTTVNAIISFGEPVNIVIVKIIIRVAAAMVKGYIVDGLRPAKRVANAIVIFKKRRKNDTYGSKNSDFLEKGVWGGVEK